MKGRIIMKNFQKFINTKLCIRLSCFFIPLSVALIGLLTGGFAPFGNKDLLTAGGYESIIPYFNEFYDRFHNSTIFTYSINSGLGYDFTTVITYYLSDPLNFLILLFPKYAMLGILNILYIFKLGLAGLFFSFFIEYKNKTILKKHSDSTKLNLNPLLTIAFSISYALCSAMVSYGSNISYTTVFALFPIVILGLDKIITEKKWLTYVISLSLSIICSFYISIIVFLFTFIYILIQEYDDISHIIHSLFAKLLGDILSIGICFIVILNNFNSVFIKDDINLNFYSKGMYSNIWNVIKMSLTRSLPYQHSLDSYGVNIYAGIFCIVLLIPFMLNNKLNLFYRIRNLVAIFIFLIGGYSITSNYLFNGFYLSLNYRAFFSFIICFMLLNISYISLVHISDINLTTKGVSIICTLIIIIVSLIKCTSYDSITPFIISLEFSVLYFIVLLLYNQSKITKEIVNTVLSFLIIFEIIFSFIPALSSLGTSSKSYIETETAQYESVINAIKISIPNARVFVYKPAESNHTPLTYTVNGYDFIIALSDIEVDDYLIPVLASDSITVYANPYSLSNGFIINNDISDYSYNSLYPYTSSNIFSKEILGVNNIFDEVYGDFTSIPNPDDPYSSLMKFHISETGDFYTNLASMTFHYNNAPKNSDFYIPYISSKILIRESSLGGELKLLNKESLKDLFDYYSSTNSSVLFNTNSSNIISLNGNNTGYIVLPIQETTKWSTDCNAFAKNIAGNNLTVIKSTNNDITLRFTPVYFIYGAIISLISLLITMLIVIFCKKHAYNPSFSRIIKFVNKYDCHIILLLFSSIFFVLLLMYNCCQPFGQRSAFASDGYVQYYPIVTNFISKIFSNSFNALNYQIGYGIDNFILASGWLANPSTWSIALFDNPYTVIAYTMVHYLNFILIPQTMFLYLSKRPNRNKDSSKLLLLSGTIAYSLSSYVISYFTFFLGFAYIIPLVLLTTELLLYKKKVIPYVLVMTFTMITSNYSAFLICEFLVLFFFITNFDSIKDFFAKGFRFALSSILAAGLSGLFLIPFYLFTKMSPYKGNDIFPAINLKNTLLSSVYDLQFLHLPEPVTKNDSRTNVYCGLLVMLFLAIYLVNKNVKLSIRIRSFALIALLYFAFGNPFLNFVFHGFHKQVMVPNRFSIFMIILLITLFVDTFTQLDTINKTRIIISTLLLSILFIVAMIIIDSKSGYDLSFKATLLLTIIYAVLLILLTLNNKNIKNLLLCIMLLEIMTNSYLMSHMSIGNNVSMNELSMEQTRKIADEFKLGASNLTRTELLNYRIINGSSMTNTNSISYFSSISTKYQTYLSLYYNTLAGSNSVQYMQGNPLSNMMLSVRYFFTSIYNEYIETPSYYKILYSENGTTLYENELALNPGIFWSINNNPFYVDNDFSKDKDAIDFQNQISESVISKKIYNTLDHEIITNGLDITDNGLVKIYIDTDESNKDNTNLNIIVPSDIKGYIYLSYENKIYYLGETSENNNTEMEIDFSGDFDLNNNSEKISIASLNLENLKELHSVLSQHTMKNMSYGFNTIEGSIEAPSDGMIFFSIPSYETWEAYVDNVRIQCGEFMGGLGVPVTEGSHTIKLVYHTPGIMVGALISIISLIVFIGYILILVLHKKNTKETINDIEEMNEPSKEIMDNNYYEVTD